MSALNALKAGAYTALFTFIAGLLTAALGWLGQWQSTGIPPDVSAMRAVVLSLLFSALAGFLNAVLRYVQGRLKIGELPTYVHPNGS